MRSLVFLFVLGACGGSAGNLELAVDEASPPFGPISGGKRIVLTGSGFLFAGLNRVVVGGREAPLAAPIDNETLEVVLPPGEPGPVDITVINQNGVITAAGIFRYSAPPEVTAVSPGNVLFDSLETKITVTGSGFQDEDAGIVRVLADGVPQVDVEVVSDTQLTFTAIPGAVLALPTLEVVNDRGTGALDHAYRYSPSVRGGLLLFPSNQGENGVFSIYFDPTDKSTVTIRHTAAGNGVDRMSSVLLDSNGDYVVFDRQQRFGRLDATRQDLVDTVATNLRISAMSRRGDDVYAILADRGENTAQFGQIDLQSLTFSPLGPGLVRGKLAIDATQAFMIERERCCGGAHTLLDVDLGTGERSKPRTISGIGANDNITGAVLFNGQLFALTREGNLLQINTTTGVATTIKSFNVNSPALEVLP